MVRRLKQRLTFPNPDYGRAAKQGRDTDAIEPMVRYYREKGWSLFIPRGAMDILRNTAGRFGVKLEWVSKVTSRAVKRVSQEELDHQPRPYQAIAIQRMLSRVQGYIVAPCGAGKTWIGGTAAVMSGEPTIFLVHTHDLLAQWVKQLRSWGYVTRAISDGQTALLRKPLGMIFGRPEFAVIMVRTLKNAGDAADPILRSAGAIVVDECHHTPADSFASVLARCPARHRWGVTATPDREDGWSFAIPLMLGPEVWRISMPELVALGFLMMPKLIPVYSNASVDLTKCKQRGGKFNTSKAVNELAKHPVRHALLMRLARLLARAGRAVLLLVPRVEQAQRIAAELNKAGILSAAVTGKSGKTLRSQRLRHMREGKLSVLVATQLADEGLDVPIIDAMIIASTGKAAGRAIQRIGRSMRISDGKRTPLVIDIVDPSPFLHQWYARVHAYRKELEIQPVDVLSEDQVMAELSDFLGVMEFGPVR